MCHRRHTNIIQFTRKQTLHIVLASTWVDDRQGRASIQTIVAYTNDIHVRCVKSINRISRTLAETSQVALQVKR